MDSENENENEKLSNSISIDNQREEMSWNENIQNLLTKWSMECGEISEKHYKASKQKKKIYYILQFPIICLPFILSFSSSFYGENTVYNTYISSIGNLFLGVLSGFTMFINYGIKYVQHEIASNRYNEICIDIESILVKRKKYRIAADITLERFTQRIESLNKYSIAL